jgi:hypothetical protein
MGDIDDKSRNLSTASAGIGLLNETITKRIHEGHNAIKQAIMGGKPPRILVLLLISNLSSNYITNGEYHTYRGTLSLKGMNLMALWNYTMDELERAGEISKADKENAIHNIREAIKEVG